MTTFILRAASFGRFSATADGMENSTATSASGADGMPGAADVVRVVEPPDDLEPVVGREALDELPHSSVADQET